MRLFVAILMVCGVGLGAIYTQTDGFTVLTTEAARRADVRHNPRIVPDAPLRTSDSAAGATTLLRNLKEDGRIAIINFMYTRCFSICLAMGTQFQQLQAEIKRQGLGSRVRLLSISFDLADSPNLLSRYEQRMKFDTEVWRSAVMADAAASHAVLDAFGIVVVAAPMGQYEHNAAYHLVMPDGRLVRIIDMDDDAMLLEYAMALAAKGASQ